MTSGRPQWHQPILVLAFLTWAVDATTIENCNFEDTYFIRIDSPKTFQCQEDPVYNVTSQEAGLESALFYNGDEYNEWLFFVNPTLNLEIAGTCPFELEDAVCGYFEMRIGSSYEAKNGSKVTFQGERRFGELNWVCNATDQNGELITVAFVFYIVGTGSDSDSDISPEGAKFLKNVLWNAGDYYTTNRNDLDIMKLQKFDKVTADSELIFAQGNDEEGHFKGVLFTSEDVAIKVSENMYNIMTTSGPPSNVQVTGQTFDDHEPCEHYYKLMFPEQSSTEASTLGTTEASTLGSTEASTEDNAKNSTHVSSAHVAQLSAGLMMLIYYLWLIEF